MSKKLISFMLAILFIAGIAALYPAPVKAARGDLLKNITISYKNETIIFKDLDNPPKLTFIQYALNSAAQDSDDAKLLAKEKWQVVRLVGGVVEIDISRVIPKAGKPNYNVAFMIPGDANTRSVVEIPARPANRTPATGVPDINVGKPRNEVGIYFEFEDQNDETRIINRCGTDVVIEFPSNAKPVELANKRFFELAMEDEDGKAEPLAISTNALTRAQAFNVYIGAVEIKDAEGKITGGSFASLPIKMTIPSQPKAPVIRQSFPKNDPDKAELNFKAGKIVNNEIRTGFPQVRLNGETWVTLEELPGTKTPLSFVLEALRDADIDLTWPAGATSRSLYIRIGPTASRGVSAVQRLEIMKDHWDRAVSDLPEDPGDPIDP